MDQLGVLLGKVIVEVVEGSIASGGLVGHGGRSFCRDGVKSLHEAWTAGWEGAS